MFDNFFMTLEHFSLFAIRETNIKRSKLFHLLFRNRALTA